MEAAASYSYCRPDFLPPHFSSSSSLIKCSRFQKFLPERCSTNCLCERRILGSGKGISSSSSSSKNHERKATNSSQQEEEIIALFRRIRIAISKTKSSGNTDDASFRKESLTDDPLSGKAKNKLKGKQGRTKGQQGMLEKQVSQSSVQTAEELAEFTLSRPPTNFVRRSPISSPSAPTGKDDEFQDGKSAALQGDQLENQKLEQMKLLQLKELAKSRGAKGYSKLKKQELVELLKCDDS